MKRIRLNDATYAIVDDDSDADKFRWYRSPSGPRIYAKRAVWSDGVRTWLYLHRHVMGLFGPRDGRVVDHLNGDTLDCRKQNLRICSQGENLRNKAELRKDNSTGYPGVTWNKQANRFKATIFNKGATHLGFYDTVEEAAAARKAAEDRLWGFSPRREAFWSDRKPGKGAMARVEIEAVDEA